MSPWTDVTAYSRDERGKVEPRTWELTVGAARLVVTRHRDYPGSWVMCGYGILSFQRELKAKTALGAQMEATKVLRSTLNHMQSALADSD
jgi:hypothetical protein